MRSATRTLSALIVPVLFLLFGWQRSNLSNFQDTKQAKNLKKVRTVLFLGNSLTAGYGVGPSQAFPALIQQKIDSLGWRVKVVNAGLSGETSSGGLRRIGWLLKRPIDILVLELGANDMLRGLPLALTERNLQAIIDTTRSRYPEVQIVIAGMQALPNLGATYANRFRAVFPELAKRNGA
ncbi:MAG: arylesterase, partial [Calditrichaeota bacterium]